MKKFIRLTMAACMAAIAMPAMAQSDCTPITTLPVTITTGGNYCLAQNATVNAVTGTSISINSNDVTLDCRNFTIRNTATSSTGSSIAIGATTRNMVKIKNCRIVGGFHTGIKLYQNNAVANQSFYNAIEDNYVAGPTMYGIVAYGSAIEVRHNRVFDIGGQANSLAAGIRVGGSNVSGQFRHQVIEGNRVVGVWSAASNAYGILSDNSLASVFRENLTTGVVASLANFRSYGVRISAGTANTITDNYVMGGGKGNEVGIETPVSGGWCYDNQIRVSLTNTSGCDASYGNY